MRILSKRHSGLIVSVDMDETILCSVPDSQKKKIDLDSVGKISVFKNGEKFISSVYVRPGAEAFLNNLKELGSVCLFTLGVPSYVTQVMEVCGLSSLFDRILTRADCEKNSLNLSEKDLSDWGVSRSSAVLIKDLRLLDEDLSKIIACDDSPFLYPAPQRRRVIEVPRFQPWLLAEDKALLETERQVAAF